MNIETVIKDPSKVFYHPDEVVRCKEFTKDEKIKILKSWAYDIEELEKAEEENMGGGETESYTLLRKIENLILQLDSE
jgi:hypothetical protein